MIQDDQGFAYRAQDRVEHGKNVLPWLSGVCFLFYAFFMVQDVGVTCFKVKGPIRSENYVKTFGINNNVKHDMFFIWWMCLNIQCIVQWGNG